MNPTKMILATAIVLACIPQPETLAQVDVQALDALGLQVTESQHLTLITDVRARSDVAEFNKVFEKAVEQWCQYFEVPLSSVKDWHLTGCVILDPRSKQTFMNAGLIPEELPPFPAGFQRGSNIWLYLQDGDYYTRHLLLHEGTHAFMQEFLGGYGAAWYAEGIAELLAVHQWKDGNLELRHQITNREEVPFWGRVKLVRKDRDAGGRLSLAEVMAMPGTSFQQVRAYGWAWAACEFLDSHPDFQTTFRKLPSMARLPDDEFNRRFLAEMADQWPAANFHWDLMVDEIDYGYDVRKSKPVPVSGRSINGTKTEFDLAADRGWQSTEIVVGRSDGLKITTSGMFRVKQDSDPWPSDAAGVTLEYYRGRPLGRLIAAVKQDNGSLGETIDIGIGGRFEFDESGTLYMRINESPASWKDNQGKLHIRVESVQD